jgi:hypothetical protein
MRNTPLHTAAEELNQRTQKALRFLNLTTIVVCVIIGIVSIAGATPNISTNATVERPKYTVEKKLLVTHDIFTNQFISNLSFRPLFISEPETSIRADVRLPRIAEQMRALNRKPLSKVLTDSYRAAELMLCIKFMLRFIDPLRQERTTILSVINETADFGERALKIWETDRTMCNLSLPVATIVGELVDGFRDIATQLKRDNSRYLTLNDVQCLGFLTKYHPPREMYDALKFENKPTQTTTPDNTTEEEL